MLKALLDLFKVKSIVTLMMYAVFSVLALRGSISPEMFMVVMTAVTTYYFTKEKDVK